LHDALAALEIIETIYAANLNPSLEKGRER